MKYKNNIEFVYPLAEIIKEEDLEKLKFFTAVDGPLDLHHIDFFFTWQPQKNGPEALVTFDITKNPNKDEPLGRTDVLISDNIPDPDENEKEYLRVISVYADFAVEALLRDFRRKIEQAREKQAKAMPKRRELPKQPQL